MERYKNLSGKSGVAAFENGEDNIIVQFKDGGKYLYNNAVTGAGHIVEMKKLAISGRGLNSYINRHVRKAYASKLN
ncbi:MAG: hypothetical protein U9R38_07780 [Candidatus Margulisiibacteriota bacterium]|nr:hypothetical protein [Candidatus Margulisiibacteriota bacterium]